MICLGTSCFWHMLFPSHSTASVMALSWKRRSSEREPHSCRNSAAWERKIMFNNRVIPLAVLEMHDTAVRDKIGLLADPVQNVFFTFQQ